MKIRTAVLVVASVLSMQVHAADYCLHDVCLGDSLSKHMKDFSFSEASLASMQNPACAPSSGLTLPTKKESDMTVRVDVKPNPSLAGKPNGEYYVVASISLGFRRGSQALADVFTSAREVATRLNLKVNRNGEKFGWRSEGGKGSIELMVNPSNGYFESEISLTNLSRRDSGDFSRQAGCRGRMPKL